MSKRISRDRGLTISFMFASESSKTGAHLDTLLVWLDLFLQCSRTDEGRAVGSDRQGRSRSLTRQFQYLSLSGAPATDLYGARSLVYEDHRDGMPCRPERSWRIFRPPQDT